MYILPQAEYTMCCENICLNDKDGYHLLNKWLIKSSCNSGCLDDAPSHHAKTYTIGLLKGRKLDCMYCNIVQSADCVGAI
jgi:hypothetical protein